MQLLIWKLTIFELGLRTVRIKILALETGGEAATILIDMGWFNVVVEDDL